MFKKILLGLLIIGTGHIYNDVGASEINSTIENKKFLNTIIEQLHKITEELKNNNTKNPTINYCLYDMMNRVNFIINMLKNIVQKRYGVITHQDILKTIEFYCNTINAYNLSEKRILNIIHKKQANNTLLKSIFASDTNEEIDNELTLLICKNIANI